MNRIVSKKAVDYSFAALAFLLIPLNIWFFSGIGEAGFVHGVAIVFIPVLILLPLPLYFLIQALFTQSGTTVVLAKVLQDRVAFFAIGFFAPGLFIITSALFAFFRFFNWIGGITI